MTTMLYNNDEIESILPCICFIDMNKCTKFEHDCSCDINGTACASVEHECVCFLKRFGIECQSSTHNCICDLKYLNTITFTYECCAIEHN